MKRKRLYEELLANIKEAEEIYKNEDDKEMVEMASDQLTESKQHIQKLEEEIKVLLIPKDPDDSKNASNGVKSGYWRR